jgi:uncharacterized protein YebE (UPF0316 family)
VLGTVLHLLAESGLAEPAAAAPVTDWTSLAGGSALIFFARIADVSLGTLRTVAVIRGRRGTSWALGFVEVLIWVIVVSEVITTVKDNWVYAIAYALGFATGNFIGITIEQYFAFGEQVIRVFTRSGGTIAARLRDQGFGVTEFEGRGKDGPVQILFVTVRRRLTAAVIGVARGIDPTCYYTVDDIRTASTAEALALASKPLTEEGGKK